MLRYLALLAALAVVAAASPIFVTATANGISVTGSLATANSVDVFNFMVASAGTVGVQSWGYGGVAGNAAGHSVAAGGFQSQLSLFGSDGTILADSASFYNSNGTWCTDTGGPANLEPLDSSCGDPSLSVALTSPGSYYIAIVAASNYATGVNLDLGDPGAAFVLDSGSFIDSFGTATADYAYDITGPVALPGPPSAPNTVPEPATWLLLLTGLALVALERRRFAHNTR